MTGPVPDRTNPPVHPAVPAVPEVRISDAEHDRAVAFLRHHCADGLITLDEFSDRVGHVYAATTSTEIEQVTADLPKIERATSGAVVPSSDKRRRRAARWTVSLFSSNQQRGRWRIEGETAAVSVMGHCVLDLRQAEVVGDEAVITAFAFMGGVEIIVPEGIEVVLEGLALMGGKQASLRNVPVLPGSPLIRVRAFAFMGGVSVRSKPPPGETKSRQDRPRDRHRERNEKYRERDDRHRQRDERHRDRDRRGLDRDDMLPSPPPPPLLRGIDAVAGDVQREWPALRARVAPEGTVTILFSDIEGFTSMNERVGDYRVQEVLNAHYALVRQEIDAHAGFEVKVHGDGFMLAFSSAARALRCARSIQAAQTKWSAKHPDTPVRVRMGLHTGEAIKSAEDDFLGSTVNLASRIAAAARGGEILVSALLKELCASSGEFDFDGGQEIELKGLSHAHRVFSVHWE